MKDRLLPISLLALAVAIGLHGVWRAPAEAQDELLEASPGAFCRFFPIDPEDAEVWMNDMLAEGRDEFFSTPQVVCAW